MMTSWYRNITFTVPLWGKSTGNFYCWNEQVVEQAVEVLVIWDTMALKWQYLNKICTLFVLCFVVVRFTAYWYNRIYLHVIFRFASFHHSDTIVSPMASHLRFPCLLSRLFMRRSKKTPKLCVTGLSGGMDSLHRGPVTRKMIPFDDVIMWTNVPVGATEVILKGMGKIDWYHTTSTHNKTPINYIYLEWIVSR